APGQALTDLRIRIIVLVARGRKDAARQEGAGVQDHGQRARGAGIAGGQIQVVVKAVGRRYAGDHGDIDAVELIFEFDDVREYLVQVAGALRMCDTGAQAQDQQESKDLFHKRYTN